MGTEIDSRILLHWEAFEKKWEDKIVQLERGSKNGAITMAENRNRTSVQKELESIWRDRSERKDKITTNNIERLRSEMRLEVMSLSPRLSEEVVCRPQAGFLRCAVSVQKVSFFCDALSSATSYARVSLIL